MEVFLKVCASLIVGGFAAIVLAIAVAVWKIVLKKL